MTVLKKIKSYDEVSTFKRKLVYVSLVQELRGYCIAVSCYDSNDAREYANEYLGKMWCSVYDDPSDMQIIGAVAYIGYDFKLEEQTDECNSSSRL